MSNLAQRVRQARSCTHRVGIVARLLLASLLAIVVAVAAVQAWTLRVAYDAQMQAAQGALRTNLAVLRNELSGIGRDWRLDEGGRLSLGGEPLNGREDLVDKVGRITGGVATIFAGDTRVATNVQGPDGVRAVGTKLAAGPARDAVIGRGEAYQGTAEILGAPYLTIYEPVKDGTGQPAGILFVGVSLANVRQAVDKMVHQGLLAGLVVILVVGTARWLALRSSMRPLGGLAASVRSIAAGDLDQPAPCADRTDQLGQIGRAIEVLREGALRAHQAEKEAANERAAKDRRGEAMERLTTDFGTAVSGVLVKLTNSADGMRSAAGGMAQAADRTKIEMESTAADANTSSRSLATVAAATEELTASVGEISRQVSQAAIAAQDAVVRARSTDTTVAGLSDAAGQISEVVRLISDIAGQTNLLALNATIEAARAGDAGKGFAVVAAEVKQLASQTAQATSRISSQVGAIQAATGEAVEAVRGVATAIEQVSEIAGSIAASVKQQGAATREIAAQVQAISEVTDSATRAMHDVCTTAERSGAISGTVLEAADQVAGLSDGLRQDVDHFLNAMRAVQKNDERRRYERVPGFGAAIRLKCATYDTGSASLQDISLGGAALACEWPCDIGAEILVGLPGEAEFAPARIIDSRTGVLAVAFRQDKPTMALVTRALDALVSRTKKAAYGV
ncbi:methyl-accepting chemotaxis protein [Muricoccus aerilatus]|uniref:methyl-accepting chemotaxis protein n=1 Tax=Muricoccus aerilatus TaxID=452982 RepID=UPI00146FC9D9|nr:cache domain-containing protein [Roseomonas aerilata]